MILSKAVFFDFKEVDVPTEYLGRMKKVVSDITFVSQQDPNLPALLAEAEIIFATFSTKVDREMLEKAPKLKYIDILATAFDGVDVKTAREKNIPVSNLGGYSTEAVAEFFFAALFEAARQLEQAKQQARSEDYSFSKLMGADLTGKTLGILGAGKIGFRTAEIGMGIGMKVIYFDKEDKPELNKRGAERKTLEEVLSQSDFVSLNLVLNKETEGIVSKEKIALIKPGCVFVNLAPPTLLDQEAMIERAGKREVTFIFDHSDDIEGFLAKRFLATPNCIVYPPIGFRTKEANTAKWEILTSNLEKFVQVIPQNVVN